MESWLNSAFYFVGSFLFDEPAYSVAWFIFLFGFYFILPLSRRFRSPSIVVTIYAVVGLIVSWPNNVFIVLMFLMLALFCVGIAITLFNPGNFWICLFVICLTWFFCRFYDNNRFTAIIAKTLRPWLIGMAIVAVVYIFAFEVLIRSEWKVLFFIESAASTCEIFLERVLPSSGYVNLGLFVLFFCANVRSPSTARWSGRIEKTMARAKSLAAVLAVFTSFTFFGEGQSQQLTRAVAEEKYARLKDQSDAAAELVIALRISKHLDLEIADSADFINSVHVVASMDIESVRIDEDMDFARDKRGRIDIDKTLRQRTVRIVKERVAELREAMENTKILADTARFLDSVAIERLIGRPLSEAEIKEGKSQFEKALDKVASEVTNNGLNPLAQLLEKAGAPDLAVDIVKELYKSEASRLSKGLSQPMADRLFRPNRVSMDSAAAEVNSLAGRRVFDIASLPKSVGRPTQAERKERTLERRTIRQAFRKTMRAVK